MIKIISQEGDYSKLETMTIEGDNTNDTVIIDIIKLPMTSSLKGLPVALLVKKLPMTFVKELHL